MASLMECLFGRKIRVVVDKRYPKCLIVILRTREYGYMLHKNHAWMW